MTYLIRRSPTGHHTELLPPLSVVQAMALLEAEGASQVLGAYLEHLDIAITRCSCESGCPVCGYTTHRTWRGKGPLAPFIPGEGSQ